MYELRSALRSGALHSAVQHGRAEQPFFFLEAVMLRLSNQAIKGVTCPLLGNLCKMRVPKPQVPLETTSCTSAEAFVSTWPWREILPSANPPRGLVSVRVSWSSESKAEPGSSGVQAPLPACSQPLLRSHQSRRCSEHRSGCHLTLQQQGWAVCLGTESRAPWEAAAKNFQSSFHYLLFRSSQLALLSNL